jgi:hypothetical protein
MLHFTFSTDPAAYKELMVWLIVLAIVTVGLQYTKDVMAFLFDKIYEFFIRETS